MKSAAVLALCAASVLSAMPAVVQAQLQTCIEAGKRVIRQGACPAGAREGTGPAAAPAARPATYVTQVLGHTLLFTLPGGWKPAFKREQADRILMEFLPQDQTLQGWRELVTVQAYRSIVQGPQVTPASFLAASGAEISKSCGSQAVVQPLGPTRVGANEAFTAIMGCANLEGRGELAYYLAIRMKDDMVVMQKAMRSTPFNRDNPPLNTANAQAFFGALQPITLCDRAESPAQCMARR